MRYSAPALLLVVAACSARPAPLALSRPHPLVIMVVDLESAAFKRNAIELAELAAVLTAELEKTIKADPALRWVPRDPAERPSGQDGEALSPDYAIVGAVREAASDSLALDWRLIATEGSVIVERGQIPYRQGDASAVALAVTQRVRAVITGSATPHRPPEL